MSWRDQAARHEDAAGQLRTLVAQAQQMARTLPAGDASTRGNQAPPMHPPRQTRWQRLGKRLRGG